MVAKFTYTFDRVQQKMFPLFSSQLGTAEKIKKNEEKFALHLCSDATFLIPSHLQHLRLFGFFILFASFCHARCLQIS